MPLQFTRAVAISTLLLVCLATAERDLPPGWRVEDLADVPSHKQPRMVTLDADARIFLFENFLSDEETDHIMSLAEPSLARSEVIVDDGATDVSNVRTSSGMFLERGQDPIIAAIEDRIARWTLMPVGNGEGLQVLRYLPGQEYVGHYDYFFTDKDLNNGGNRYATVLCYLNDVEEGGETTFPNIPAPGGDNGPGFSDCARHHLAAKPRKGNCVLFHSISSTGELETRSLHTACPVIRGVKWSAPKWIHVGHFATGDEKAVRVDQHPQFVGEYGCSDNFPDCAERASAGECTTKASWMVGTKHKPGACLMSCNRCDLLAESGGRTKYELTD